MSFGGNGVDELGIENNDVRVTANSDFPLLRVKSKDLRGIGAANGNKRLEGDFSTQNPVCVEEFNPLLDTRNAIGNERKVSRLADGLEVRFEALGGIRVPHVLLRLKIERSVIGGHGADSPVP